MLKFGIIDDNKEQSDTLSAALKFYLKKYKSTFRVKTQFPFKDTQQYFEFISENNICLLILDERLNDQSNGSDGPVDYKGNELVTILRERLKDFPIFMVTSFSTDSDVLEKESEFEYIIKREEFSEEGDKYIPKMIRAAQRYLQANIDELNEYDILTREVAGGNNNPEFLKKLNALHIKLELPISGFVDRSVWLDEYNNQITKLEKIRQLLKKKLNKK